MIRKKVVLITGASGEIGTALIRKLAESQENQIISIDINPLESENQSLSHHIIGDILDKGLLSRLVSEYEIDTIYHLAAMLSTRAEFKPDAAHNTIATLCTKLRLTHLACKL